MKLFLTGATGFLGGELLVQMSQDKRISKIYCLIRAHSDKDMIARLEDIFNLHGDHLDRDRIIPVRGDLVNDHLIDHLDHNKELADVTHIVHSAANTSFSRRSDQLVEKVNIQGLSNILKWAASLKKLETFVYVGTATICGKDVTNCVVHEKDSPNLKANHLVKYTFTKMMGELLLHEYLPENKILIVRPSIIMGDSRPVFPRSPVILWTVATSNLLRLITVDEKANMDIIPVDYAVRAILKLLFAKRHHNVYHISAGTGSASSGLKLTGAIERFFPDRPKFAFVPKKMLNMVKRWASKKTVTPELEPYKEYLDYWEETFGENSKLRIILAGFEPYLEFIELGQVFDNSRLLKDTDIGPPPPAHEYINNSIKYLNKIDVFAAALDP